MVAETLFTATGDSFHLVDMNLSDLDTLRMQLTTQHPEAVIRLLRGLTSLNSQSFFEHMATAFHFPHYFGANWPALKDSLGEQRHHHAVPHLLIISHANRLLANEPYQVFENLLDVLAAIQQEWQNPCPDEGVPSLSFKCLFQEHASGFPALQQRFGRLRHGVDWWRWDGHNLTLETPQA